MVPAGLILLSFVPSIGASVRLQNIMEETATPDNARFVAMPAPVVVHIVAAVIFSYLGALQFAPALRRRRQRWHRVAGRMLVPAGFAVALSGLWMTQFYPTATTNHDGVAVYWERIVVGVWMTASLFRGVLAVRARAFADHEAWMTRAYAIAMGAGTQVFTHLPLMLAPSLQGELTRAVAMGSAWLINAAVAEWSIRRSRRSGRARATASARAAAHAMLLQETTEP